jgi:hypothetical protein
MIDNIALLACNFFILYAIFQLIKIEKQDSSKKNKEERK